MSKYPWVEEYYRKWNTTKEFKVTKSDLQFRGKNHSGTGYIVDQTGNKETSEKIVAIIQVRVESFELRQQMQRRGLDSKMLRK